MEEETIEKTITKIKIRKLTGNPERKSSKRKCQVTEI
jgi:hypothetical protein